MDTLDSPQWKPVALKIICHDTLCDVVDQVRAQLVEQGTASMVHVVQQDDQALQGDQALQDSKLSQSAKSLPCSQYAAQLNSKQLDKYNSIAEPPLVVLHVAQGCIGPVPTVQVHHQHAALVLPANSLKPHQLLLHGMQHVLGYGMLIECAGVCYAG